MLKKVLGQPKSMRLPVRVVSLLAAATTLAALLIAPDAGYVDPDAYEKTFLGGPGLGVHWVYMTGPVEGPNPDTVPADRGIPGGKIGTFCTHPRMAGGGDFGFTQYKNDQRGANPYLNAIISLSGMNATYLSEMRYAIALGLTNGLMATQSAYWAYLNYRRPDLFAEMESSPFEMNATNMQLWFGSKPGSFPAVNASLTVPPPPTGLFVGDKAPVRATYNGGNVPAALTTSQVTNDVAGPFNFAWNISDPAWSPALAQLNYGLEGNTPPTFTVTTPYVRMYTVDPNTNPSATPVGSVPIGTPFYVKYVGPERNPATPLNVTVTSSVPITTELLCDRFFYCYVAEYQYTVELKREPIKITLDIPCKGKDTPPPERPDVVKDVTQWDRQTNDGPYDDMIEVPLNSDALYRMTIDAPSSRDTVYKFGYKDLTVRPDEIGKPGIQTVGNNPALFKQYIEDSSVTKIKLTSNITLPPSWTAVNLNNTIIDGAGYTISNTGTLTQAVFNVATGSAINNIRFNINVNQGTRGTGIYPTGAVFNDIKSGCELRNVYAEGNLSAALTANHRQHMGFVTGEFNDGNILVSGLTVVASVTKTGTNDDCHTAMIGGNIYGTKLSDIKILESTISANSGMIMVVGPLAAGSASNYASVYNLLVDNITVVDAGSVENVSGVGWLHPYARLERFTINFKAGPSNVRYFYGIGDIQAGSTGTVTIRKGKIDIPFAVSGTILSGAVGGNGSNTGAGRAVNMSEVEVHAAGLTGVGAAGLLTTSRSLVINIENCSTTGGTVHSSTTANYYCAGGLVAHTDHNSGTINIKNCWTDMNVTSYPESKSKAMVMGLDGDGTYNGSASGCYALGGTTLIGTNAKYIFSERLVSGRITTPAPGNFRTMAPPPGTPNDDNNGTYVPIANCQGAAAGNAGTLNSMAQSGWSIGGSGTANADKVWETTSGYPKLRDVGYNDNVDVYYVHDYYYPVSPPNTRTLIPVSDLVVYQGGGWPNIRSAAGAGLLGRASTLDRSPEIYPQPTGTTNAHIFIPAGGSFTFYLRQNKPNTGLYHNIVYLTQENGGWPGASDDAWVEVKAQKARLNIVKMLLDTDYLTTLDGCTFRLTEYENSTFSGTGTVRGTISPIGMDGATFNYDLKPGCTYKVEEIAPYPANIVPGGPWYVTYTDVVRVYTDPLCRPGPAPVGDELDVGSSSSATGGVVTTVYSYKVINQYGPGVKRGKLHVIKWNEDGQEIGAGVEIKDENGVTIGYTGALFSVLRCNTNTGADTDFTGPNEAFGHILVCGNSALDNIELPPGRYILVELQPPAGYGLDTTQYWITVDNNGMITSIVDKHDPDADQINYIDGKQTLEAEITGRNTASVTVKAKNKKPDYQLQLTKVKASDGTPIKDVEFIVTGTYGPANQVFGPYSYFTNEDGLLVDEDGETVINFKQLNGTYTITEIAPNAYEPIPSITVECIDGEMFLIGGPAGWARGDVVIKPGGWVFRRVFASGGLIDQDFRIYDTELAAMGLTRLENGIIARAHIGLELKNHPRETGQLKLAKIVTVEEGEEIDTDKEFTFKVNFDGGIGDIKLTVNGVTSTYTPNNKEFTLKHNQTAVFTEIPFGTRFTITENDYTGDGYSTSFDVPVTNVLINGATPVVNVTCANIYEPSIETTIDGKKTFDVTGEPQERDFEFTIEQISGPPGTPEATLIPPAVTVHYPGDGEFSFTVSDLMEGTYVFRITETTPGGGWTANTGPQDVTVVVVGRTVTVTYPTTGGAASGSSVSSWQHVTPSGPFGFDTGPQYGSFRYGGGTSSVFYNFEVRDSDGNTSYRGLCGNVNLSAPSDGAVVRWDTSVNLDGTYRALAAALAFEDYGAMLSHAQFFDLFGRPAGSSDTRFGMMQNVIWYYSSGSSNEITQIRNMMNAYNDSGVTSEAISSLTLDYDPETGKIAMNHVGFQPLNPHTRLSWSGDVTGLTVVINGATYTNAASPAGGIAVNRSSSINVAYTGTGNVVFTLTDSQLYLKKGSIEGGQLETANPGTRQPVVIGYAEFGTLQCDLTLEGGGSSETLKFTNTYTPPDKPMVTIYGIKHFLLSEEDSAPGSDPFPSYDFIFTISQVTDLPCTLPAPPTVTVPYPGSGTFSFDVTDLEDGIYVFRVTETTPPDGTYWTAHTPPQDVTVVVSGSTVTVTYPDGEPTVSFDNEYGIPFEFRKDGYGVGTFGAGDAVFELYRLGCGQEHDHEELVTAGSTCWVLLDTAETDADGMVYFGLLGSGDYMLVETKTRPGYQIPLGQWLVHVEVSAEKQIVITAYGDMLPPAFYEDVDGNYVLMNFPKFEMPRAGSFSLLLFTAGGAALVGSAAFLGVISLGGKKRRRKAG